MPKEQINTPARRTITQMRDEKGKPDGSWALGWAQDGDQLNDGQHWEDTPTVYLAWDSSAPDTLPPSVILHVDINCDEVLRAAAEITRMRERDDITPLEHWMFHTVVLDREEIQKLIRTARRARNAVFGGDE